MAIDTRAKRFAMMNFVSGSAVHLQNLFEADGAVDADDRAHLLDLYGGIALGGAPAAAAPQFHDVFRFQFGGLGGM